MADTPKTVILSAPQGWGKTTNAAGLQAEFGCTSIVDGWSSNDCITKGALHLTNQPPHELKAIARRVPVIVRGWNQQRQAGIALPTLTAWLAGITLALVIGCAHYLDDIPDHRAEWDQAVDLQAAIVASIDQQKFDRAAQALCGPQAAWAQMPDGAVQCSTKYGKPTITVRVSP